jgi:hypothetical protein
MGLRECRWLYLSAWKMRRRIYRRFGYRLEIQRDRDGISLWRPGEEIKFVRN